MNIYKFEYLSKVTLNKLYTGETSLDNFSLEHYYSVLLNSGMSKKTAQNLKSKLYLNRKSLED